MYAIVRNFFTDSQNHARTSSAWFSITNLVHEANWRTQEGQLLQLEWT